MPRLPERDKVHAVHLLMQSFTLSQVARQLGVAVSTGSQLWQRLRVTGLLVDRTLSGLPCEKPDVKVMGYVWYISVLPVEDGDGNSSKHIRTSQQQDSSQNCGKPFEGSWLECQVTLLH